MCFGANLMKEKLDTIWGIFKQICTGVFCFVFFFCRKCFSTNSIEVAGSLGNFIPP